MERKNELLIRAYVVLLLFVVFAAVVFYRVVKVSVIQGDQWRSEGGKNVKMSPLQAQRGSIYSDDGSVLVTSLPFFDIRMDLMASREKTFYDGVDSLSRLVHLKLDDSKSATQWRQEMISGREDNLPGRRYFKIADNITYNQLMQIKDFPIFRKGRYGGGLIIEKRTVRQKPFKSLAKRTLGEVRDNASNYGLESYFDANLKGQTDSILTKRIPGGKWIPVYNVSEAFAKQGDDLYTTLDVDVQDIVQKELLNSLIENKAKGGAAIVMDVKTGGIKAISNFKWSEKRGGFIESYNHAIGTLSEPGSTFKTATVLSLLDDGLVTESTLIDLNKGKKKFYSEYMYDSSPHGLQMVDLKKAFAISSNVGIASLAMDHYERKDNGRVSFRKNLAKFRLDKKVGLKLEGEANPQIKNPSKSKSWSGTTIPWMSHGYELSLTPLQILAFYNAIANNGRYMKPYIVSEIRRDGKILEEFKPIGTKRPIANAKAIGTMHRLLEEVVNKGTAKSLQSDIVSMAGKTGTARSDYSDSEDDKKYNASFAGYFPAKKPRYSIMVVVYEPEVNYHGAQAAGTVFKAIAEKVYAIRNDRFDAQPDYAAEVALPEKQTGYVADFTKVFNHTGIKYDKNAKSWAVLDPEDDKMKIEKLKFKKSKVPNVAGMGLRDAIYVLENLGLEVYAEGVGKVKNQSLKPGTKINGQAINLYLN